MSFTGRIKKGSSAALNNNLQVVDGDGNAYTLPANTGNVKVQLKPTDTYYLSTLGFGTVNFYLCNGNTKVLICQIALDPPQKSGGIPDTPASVNLSSLANKQLYARFEWVSGYGENMSMNGNYLPIEIKDPYTAVTSGNKCVTGDINQTGASVSAGTVMSNSHFSAGTKIEASTFNSQVLGL